MFVSGLWILWGPFEGCTFLLVASPHPLGKEVCCPLGKEVCCLVLWKALQGNVTFCLLVVPYLYIIFHHFLIKLSTGKRQPLPPPTQMVYSFCEILILRKVAPGRRMAIFCLETWLVLSPNPLPRFQFETWTLK